MDKIQGLQEQAERYRLLVQSVTDDLAILAMNAMVDDLEKQAMLLESKTRSADKPPKT
jgi:hypothetical protein